MKRRILAILTAALLALGCIGCGADDEPDPAAPEAERTPSQTSGAADEAPEAMSLSVNRTTGKLTISRPRFSGGAKSDSGVWTVFVYLCGSDLESDGGMATDDLIEMVDGTEKAGVRFVVETGGANEWYNDRVSDSKLQRFLVQDGDFELVDERSVAGMGQSDTFADFLKWGVENYASEHMGLVLWNHGGGSITGVCFDETDGYDSLSLRELDGALFSACGSLGRKFDFIGFDACLMGSLETANILASYADYMYGSEETEPGSGWDYTSIGRYLGANPGADGKQLGIVVCDSFLEACRQIDDDDLTTLAVIDLAKLDALLVSFNDFAKNMYDSGSDSAACAAMIRGIEKADNFGGNNRSEGYTNMVDMGGIVSACSNYAAGADKVLAALDDAVAYSVSGATHTGASGLSMYYPLSVQGSEELSIFGDVCPSPYYLSFVDRQNQGSVDVGAADDYSDDFWFDDDGEWFWGWLDEDDVDYYDYYGYWDYLNGYEQTGESPYITFEVEPYLDEEGDFWFALDDNGYDYAADVYGIVYEISPDGADLIELGQTYDLRGGWDTGVFIDDFDGYWLSLPDGQNLATYIVEDAGDHVIYTSPILLNDKETNLRLRQDYSTGLVTIEGAWDGLNEYGAAARDIVKLKDGDVIVPLYYAYAIDSDDEFYYYGWEYVVDGAPEIYYDIMEDGDYLFSFCIDDIYGDYYLTDSVTFNVEDGEAYYYVD